MPDAATVQGDMFERQVLNHLCGIRTLTFSIRGLTDSNQAEWTCHRPIRCITFEDPTFSNELTKAIRKRETSTFGPFSYNFAAVGSIIYDPPSDLITPLTCIQVTMNPETYRSQLLTSTLTIVYSAIP